MPRHLPDARRFDTGRVLEPAYKPTVEHFPDRLSLRWVPVGPGWRRIESTSPPHRGEAEASRAGAARGDDRPTAGAGHGSVSRPPTEPCGQDRESRRVGRAVADAGRQVRHRRHSPGTRTVPAEMDGDTENSFLEQVLRRGGRRLHLCPGARPIRATKTFLPSPPFSVRRCCCSPARASGTDLGPHSPSCCTWNRPTPPRRRRHRAGIVGRSTEGANVVSP